MRKLIAICICMVSFITPGSLKETNGLDGLQKEIFRNFYRGDCRQLFFSIEKLLQGYPTHPVAVSYYNDLVPLAEIVGPDAVRKTLTGLMESIAHRGGAKSGACLYLLRLQLERFLYLYDRSGAVAVTDSIGPIRDWVLSGPYNRYGPGDISYPFTPEIITDYKKTPYKRKTVYLQNPDAYINMGDYIYPRYGAAYAMVSFKISSPVKIRIYSESKFIAFINGKKVVSNLENKYSNLRILRVWNTPRITLLIKQWDSAFKRFRVVVSDDNDRPVKQSITNGVAYRNSFSYKELMEYPFAELNAMAEDDPAMAYFYLGTFFYDLGSDEAIEYYSRSLQLRDDAILSYFYGNAMIGLNNRRGSAGYLKGWQIIQDVCSRHRDFVPAHYVRFKRFVEEKNYEHAYKAGIDLISGAPMHLYSHLSFLAFLNKMGYEKEFLEYIQLSRERFPYAVSIIEAEADYLKGRDRGRYLEICLEIEKKKYSWGNILSLINHYRSAGDYARAISLINKYKENHELRKVLLQIIIDSGDFPRARSQIFKELLVSDDPDLFAMLGQLDIMEKIDPVMYYSKLVKIDPSRFDVSDYIDYLVKGYLSNPFDRFSKSNPEDHGVVHQDNDGINPAEVLNRNRVFILLPDGSSRVYCEDIVQIHTREGVRKWGEYKIPYQGDLQPIHFRVVGDRAPVDSYRIQKVNGSHYVTVNSLKNDSVLHLSYIVNNPITTPRRSNFFSLPPEFLQDYNEPVRRFSATVIIKDGTQAKFNSNIGLSIKETAADSGRIYSFEVQNLKGVKREDFSGSKLVCLPYYTFSTMRKYADFVNWYNGLVSGKLTVRDDSKYRFLKKETLMDTVASVYNYISRNIDKQPNVLHYPGKADDTLYRMKGTPEDKVILAKAILDAFGIKSYFSFAREWYNPDVKGYVSPEVFSHILLYVPISDKKGEWLDFSSQFRQCGMTDESIAGTESLVIVGENYAIKKITPSHDSAQVSDYDIRINDDGSCDFNVVFELSGSYGEVRRFFKNRLYHEENIHSYIADIIPSLKIGNYKLENLKNYDKHFTISVSGTGLGLATVAPQRLILQPMLQKSTIYEYIRYSRRNLPLVIETPVIEAVTYRYSLPKKFIDYHIKGEYESMSRFGGMKIQISKDKGNSILSVKKRLHVQSNKISQNEYPEFLKFILDIRRLEYNSISITMD